MTLKSKINGKWVKLQLDPRRRLLDVLREDLSLTGTREGCGRGECGSCTVFLNGHRVNSCLVPALQLEGSEIWTIEGLQQFPVFRKLEQVFVEQGAVQCGFCIPGMVMSAAAFLSENARSGSNQDIASGLAGNLCRCTGYTKILEVLKILQHQPDIVSEIKETLPL